MSKQDQKKNFALKLIRQTNLFLDCFIEDGLFDESCIRNFRLKLRYNELVFNDIKAKDARQIVSDEFYLGDEAIQKIIYSKGKKEMPANKKTGITRHV